MKVTGNLYVDIEEMKRIYKNLELKNKCADRWEFYGKGKKACGVSSDFLLLDKICRFMDGFLILEKEFERIQKRAREERNTPYPINLEYVFSDDYADEFIKEKMRLKGNDN